MYFIARNNKVYSYIASTKSIHRYIFTATLLATVLFVGVYCLYYPLHAYNALLAREIEQSHRKYGECNQLEKQSKDFERQIEGAEKIIQSYTVLSHQQNSPKTELLFITDALQRFDLILHSYSVLKEKDEGWYKKEMVHIEVSGTFEQCVRFLECIKKSEKMISIGRFSLNCSVAPCKMSCDIVCMKVQKTLQL